MKTGNTTIMLLVALADDEPQWSPVMKTGNTCREEPGANPH